MRRIQNKSVFIFIFDKNHPDPVMGRGWSPLPRDGFNAGMIKYQAGPLMVPAYLNVRATGGAVESLAKDWREI